MTPLARVGTNILQPDDTARLNKNEGLPNQAGNPSEHGIESVFDRPDPRVSESGRLLEPKLADKVHPAPQVLRTSDPTKVGRIKSSPTKIEIGMIEGIDRRGLDLKPDCFRYRNPLGNTQVYIEECRTRQRVYREITEGARGRCRHQARLKPRRSDLSDMAA